MGNYSIPKHILDVERPKASRIIPSNKHYYVYNLVYEQNKHGKTISKADKRIGEIIHHEEKHIFKPVEPDISKLPCSFLKYGAFQLILTNCRDILDSLKEHFTSDLGLWIFTAALLRVTNPRLRAHSLQDKYNKSYCSVYFPNIPFSENTINKRLTTIGLHFERRNNYMQQCISFGSGEYYVDGSLSNNTSKQSGLSAFGRGDKNLDSPVINKMFIYDAQEKVPVYYKMFRGNIVDSTAIIDVVEQSGIKNVLIIADKGFQNDKLVLLYDQSGLDYLMPIKKNSLIIAKYFDYTFDRTFQYGKNTIRGRKIRMDDGHFLYCFQDTRKAKRKLDDFVSKIGRDSDHTFEILQECEKKFGVIVLITKMDRDPLEVLLKYISRWDIEQYNDHYKNVFGNDILYLHSRESSEGWEFVSFIMMQMFYRIYNKVKQNEYLANRWTPMEVIFKCNDLMVCKIGEEWRTDIYAKVESKFFEELGIAFNNPSCPQKPKEIRKRGRKKKILSPEEQKIKEERENQPKKPRGRPKKVLSEEEIKLREARESEPKRPRGRPKKIF